LSLAQLEGPSRLAALRRGLRAGELDAMIVSDPVGVHYLTGFPREAFGLALVAGEWASFVTVEGFAAEAEGLAAGFELELLPRGVWGRVHHLLGERLRSGARIGFQSEQLTHASFSQLAGALSALAPVLVAADEQLANLRAVKSPAELELLRAAAAPLPEVFTWLSEQRLVGLTERELAWLTERRLREHHGVDAMAFETVIACGAHGAIPHHTASQMPVGPGQLLVVDIGCVIDGYRSDMTRTLAIGPPDERAVRVHELVRAAQRAALQQLAPGVCAEAVHEAAAQVIDAGGHGDRFLHSLGHGIGLELHEAPFAEPHATDVLMAGQVLTVEPGVYLDGELGVRIEDEAIITVAGYELLAPWRSDLVVCG
jgi:Xaa-Pro aminopeptidase